MAIKRLIIGIALTGLTTINAYATVVPADGFYFGGIAGGTFAMNNSNFTLDETQFTLEPSGAPVFPWGPNNTGNPEAQGSVNYKFGGDAGGQIGFRWSHIRGELEYLFVKNSYRSITLDGVEYTSGDDQPLNTPGIGGFTEANSLFLNGFYDFFNPDVQSDLDLVPYLGAGIGYSRVANRLQFSETTVAGTEPELSNTVTFHNTGVAYQAIAGIAYYLDTDTSFSLDYRYVSTPTFQGNTSSSSFSSLKPSNRFAVSSINLTMNFNLDGVLE